MRFTVAKQDLQAALTLVAPAMSSTGSDLTSHFLFRPAPDGSLTKVEVLTHSGRMAAMCPFKAIVEPVQDKLTPFTMEGWRLFKWLDSKPDAALVFSFDTATTQVSAAAVGMTRHKPALFKSLDPRNWMSWEESFQEARPTAKLSAKRLKAAIDHSRRFASMRESQDPDCCISEVVNGLLSSTDKLAASLINVAGLEKSALQVHVRDAGNLVNFLGLLGDSNVEVLENPRTVFYVRDDGAKFIAARPGVNFPQFNRPGSTDDHWWVVKADDIRTGILNNLSQAEDKEDILLFFSRPDPTGPVVLDMKVLATGQLGKSVEIDVIDSGSVPSAIPIPTEGFVVSRDHLQPIIDAVDGDGEIKIGICIKAKTGYLRFVNSKFADDKGEGGDTYVTVLSWIKKKTNA